MDFNLEMVIKDKEIILSPAHIKSYMHMLLKGVDFLHKNWILHRVRMICFVLTVLRI